ncbi:Ig-like domain-containing protein [Fusibacter sp. 3D3]|uniref:Ig-like domain-containing protein n=1 Tax=Fusibacter sp. 3D3 TaxID=1048380 RepID=UPI000853D7D7|nr:Ig-like domain-containing protein [Fusibacter sp. 3D3]GAU76799.1 S-layer domain protein [Fusibacter sp. 3D3]
MKKISLLLVTTMLCMTLFLTGGLAYAVVPYSGEVIALGLNGAMGIIIGPGEKIYVSDYSGNKIVKMDKDGSNLTTVTTNVSQPVGIAFDSSGNLIVAEHSGQKIASIDLVGNKTILKGTGLGLMTGLVVDSNDKIYAADYTNGKIYKMDADGSNSAVFTTFLIGSTPNSTSLIGMGIDVNDNLYIADQRNNKIVKVDSSGVQSDFASVNSPYWASVGKDGYVYVSSATDKSIQKFDLSGTKIETYSTETYTPWGTQVDTGGSIYFTSNSTSVNRILGYADTVDRIHVKITLLYDMVNGPADPSAFTLSGVSSNPQVISAVVSGSVIDLTLDSNIESTDTAVKVSYTKTGTNNLVEQGTSTEVDAFSNLSVKNHIVSVTSVGTLSTIHVDNGTELSAVALPATVSINLSNSTPSTTSAAVVWDGGTPAYDGNTAGTYTFSGALSLGHDVYNPNNLKASVSVVVASPVMPTITTMSAINVITVPNGTVLSAVGLPATVSFSLSNSTTSSAAVVWDGGTPPYEGNTAGTYVFAGTIASSSDYLNPNNLKASVNVVVASPVMPTITTMSAINVITVPNGTVLSAVGLPATVSFSLSNSTTSSAAVVWDGGTPPYEGNTAGTYVFAGTIASSSDYLNPNNLKASVNVVVQSSGGNDDDKSSGGGSSSSSGAVIDNAMVEVNGVKQKVSNEARTIENGKSKVKVIIDDVSMQKVLDELLKTAAGSQTPIRNLATINVQDTTADSTVIGLNGATVKQMDQNKFDILINAGNKTYRIPAEELTVDAIASRLAVAQDNLKSIQFYIQLDHFTTAEQAEITQKIGDNNGKIMVPPTQFKVSAVVTRNDGTTETVAIDTFKQYVKRGFEMPEGVNISDITTGIVFDPERTYNQVPTRVYTENGKIYAEINSLTNSIYSVISNPITVNSVEGHWSESTVNDMASRLILVNYDQFNADQNVTRGEFATYMVRALGLYRSDANFETTFTDIKKTDQNAIGIALASHWGFVSGYEDGSFKPNSEITREEAMVLFSKAMELANYEGIAGSSGFKIEDNESVSNWSKPYIQSVLDGKVFVGRSDHDLGLKENLTHAETLAALRNLLIKAGLINE